MNPDMSRTSQHHRSRLRGTSVLLLPGGILAIFLLLATLFGHIRLTALNDEAVEIAAVIEQRQRERAWLLIDHEKYYDLRRVETYAREELGMQPPRGDQLQYLETLPPDRVTLFEQEEDGTAGKVISFLDSIAACFS